MLDLLFVLCLQCLSLLCVMFVLDTCELSLHRIVEVVVVVLSVCVLLSIQKLITTPYLDLHNQYLIVFAKNVSNFLNLEGNSHEVVM